MNTRGRYPPGIGVGRGGGLNANPNFQSRPPQQHYVQRNLVQNHHQFQQQQHHQQQQQQHQQQQQWLRRNQLPGGHDSSVVDEVEKTVQSEAVDSRSLLISSLFCCCYLSLWLNLFFLFCFVALPILIVSWTVTILHVLSIQITLGNNSRVSFSPELSIC